MGLLFQNPLKCTLSHFFFYAFPMESGEAGEGNQFRCWGFLSLSGAAGHWLSSFALLGALLNSSDAEKNFISGFCDKKQWRSRDSQFDLEHFDFYR